MSRQKSIAGIAVRSRRWTKTGRARAAEFNHAILAHARSLGAVDAAGIFVPGVTLETSFGPLRIIPFDDWVACRFLTEEGTAQAAQHFNGGFCYQHVNPYSGKFNCHPSSETFAARIREAIEHINSVPRLGRADR